MGAERPPCPPLTHVMKDFWVVILWFCFYHFYFLTISTIFTPLFLCEHFPNVHLSNAYSYPFVTNNVTPPISHRLSLFDILVARTATTCGGIHTQFGPLDLFHGIPFFHLCFRITRRLCGDRHRTFLSYCTIPFLGHY